MKATTFPLVCMAGILLLPLLLMAQPYDLTWPTFAGGGGTSTAGVYTITGAIAPLQEARLHSADFTIDGGFCSIVAAIQTPGAPFLSVRLTETNTVVVSWPITWPGFVLLENAEPHTAQWAEVATPPRIALTWDGKAEKHHVVPVPVGKRFYGLRKAH